MSFLQLVFSPDKTFEEIILFWRICQVLTDITTWGNVVHPLPHLVSPCLLPALPLPGEAPVTLSWKCHSALCWIHLAYWILHC